MEMRDSSVKLPVETGGADLEIRDLKALRPIVEELTDGKVLSVSLERMVDTDGQET